MMKRKSCFWYAAGIALLAACRPLSPKTGISGQLTDIGNDTLLVTCYPLVPPLQSVAETDTLVTDNGTFAYLPPTDTLPQEITLQPKGSRYYMELMYLPGESPVISGSPADYRIEGSDFNLLYKQRGESFGTRKQCLAYIEAHPDSDFSLYLLSALLKHAANQNFLNRITGKPATDSSGLRELFYRLGRPVKEGGLAALYRYWDEAFHRNDVLQENAKVIAAGFPAPDFTLTDLQGNSFSLSSLRGKYVVLDFWGSWCGPCLDGMPKMKEYYARYCDCLQIVGIACDDTDERWRRAVADNHLPWLHVLNGTGDNDVALRYAVRSYPTKIVIDPEGKIVHIAVGEKADYYEYLDNLFKIE